MKRTHTYNPTNSKFAINKLEWHPSPEALQIITCDMQKNIAVFDYILNKVVSLSESGEGGTDFSLNSNGTILVSLNGLEIKVYEAKGLKLKFKFETEAYMESILVLDQMLYMGGEETGLFSVNMSNNKDLKYREHKGCTDTGVIKILHRGVNSK